MTHAAPSCSSCRFLRGDECRRHAPQIVTPHGEEWRPSMQVGLWPVIDDPREWCGEHQPRHLTDAELETI